MSFVYIAATRFLFSKHKEKSVSIIGLFSLAGIALGVATLIVVMAVMNGFRIEITSKLLGVSGHLHVRSGLHSTMGQDDAILADIGQVFEQNHIDASAVPVVDGQAMILQGDNARGAAVKALPPEILKRLTLLSDAMDSEAQALFEKERFSVILGTHLARSLGVSSGDEITLISPKVTSSAIGTLPRMKSFLVAGTFDSGMYEYDNNMLLMRLRDAQAFFKYRDSLTRIEIHLDDMNDTGKAIGILSTLLAGTYLDILGWEQMHAGLFNALQVERSVMFLILSLIVCVAAFNIVSGLMILVRDKHYDIAILKTLGLSRMSVMGIFFFCGAALGLTGTIIGVVLGALFAANVESIRLFLEALTGSIIFDPVIYFLSELPARLEWSNVIAASIVGILCSCLATLYPAWKAAGRRPAEALRID